MIGVHSAKFPSEKLTESIRQAVMRQGIDHPVVNDAGFKTWNAYAVRAWPTLVLIDPNGRIAGEVSGEILAEEFAGNIREVIEQNAEALDRSPLSARPEMREEPARPLCYPAKLLAAGDTLFVADTGHHRVLEIRLDPDGMGGELARVFGSGQPGLQDGPAETARFHHPHGLGLRDGTLYVADTENHALREITLESGQVSTIAGTGQKAHGRRSLGPPLETPLRSPWAVLPVAQVLMVAMAGSHQIWALTDDGQLGPFAGNGVEDLVDGPVGEASFNQPSDLAYGMGYLFVADPEASAVRAVSLFETPQVMTLVGQGLFEFGDQDGATNQALLQHAAGLAFAGTELYVADTYNNKIKLLEPTSGQVNTLIGSGTAGWQDGPFEQARLFEPEGVQELNGRLYIADTNNHLVRVAVLDTRQVHTFQLRGLDRLPVPPAVGSSAQMLPPVMVASGPARLVLDLRLPDGYKRSPDAPTVLQVMGSGEPSRYTFEAGEPVAWTVEVDADQSLTIDLTLYYCQEQEAQLCLIHDRSLVIPLMAAGDGPREVLIPYEVNPSVVA